MTRYHGVARNHWKLRLGAFLRREDVIILLGLLAMLYMAVR